MAFPPRTELHAALILDPNRLFADTLRQLMLRLFPLARIELAPSLHEASVALDDQPVDFLLIGAQTVPDGDLLDFLSARRRQYPAPRILVVAAQCDNRTLAGLRALAVPGVFDSGSENAGHLLNAIRAVANGAPYWSPSLIERVRQFQSSPNSVFRVLTAGEQLVLSIIGDGSDDVEAARHLGLRASTVASVRRNLHRKLGVQHRGELVRIAAQNGFVRFTFNGVERPGFGMLTAACQSRVIRRPAVAPV